ncbi:MAG: trypsin-like peptidase domain-containing protein [Chloroflexi bacterium]|nr:trypsin-like peptidase domain-containing protein [Chloroflexota bacterium]
MRRVIYSLLIILIAGISALSGAIAGGAVIYYFVQNQPQLVIPTPTESLATETIASDEPQLQQIIITDIDSAITDAVDKVGPAVVTVVGTLNNSRSGQTVSGSGVIISGDGYILTNNHVIDDTVEVYVILANGKELPTQIIGGDLFSDIAVLKIDNPPPQIATFGNSDMLRPGESVIAIGSPLGDFKNTVTVGVISGTERSLAINENYAMDGLLQTDAAINQGNSGGPLVNLAGEVIGINTLILRGGNFGTAIAEGLGFAIAANKAQAIAEQIIEKGYFSYPFLGVRYQWLTERIIQQYELPVNGGIYLSHIQPNSPASKAGLQEGDIITQIGDQIINQEHPFINVLYTYSPGDTTTLNIVRQNDSFEVSITFGEHPNP